MIVAGSPLLFCGDRRFSLERLGLRYGSYFWRGI